MAAKRHIHKYRRIDIGHDKNYWVMKCVEPNCTHYTPGKTKLSFPLLRGQIAKCNRCNEPFIMNKRATRMEQPCCNDCVKKKKETIEKIKSADDFFEGLMNDVAGIKID